MLKSCPWPTGAIGWRRGGRFARPMETTESDARPLMRTIDEGGFPAVSKRGRRRWPAREVRLSDMSGTRQRQLQLRHARGQHGTGSRLAKPQNHQRAQVTPAAEYGGGSMGIWDGVWPGIGTWSGWSEKAERTIDGFSWAAGPDLLEVSSLRKKPLEPWQTWHDLGLAPTRLRSSAFKNPAAVIHPSTHSPTHPSIHPFTLVPRALQGCWPSLRLPVDGGRAPAVMRGSHPIPCNPIPIHPITVAYNRLRCVHSHGDTSTLSGSLLAQPSPNDEVHPRVICSNVSASNAVCFVVCALSFADEHRDFASAHASTSTQKRV